MSNEQIHSNNLIRICTLNSLTFDLPNRKIENARTMLRTTQEEQNLRKIPVLTNGRQSLVELLRG
jgi:hypothetical protein